MSEELGLQFWQGLSKLHDDIKADKELSARFDVDPAGVLADRGLNVDLPIAAGSERRVRLAEVLEDSDIGQRRAILEAVAAVSATDPKAIPTVVAAAVAVVVIVANTVAVANANGMAADNLIRLPNVMLPEDFTASPAHQRFTQLALSDARQRALLRRTLTSFDNVVSAETSASGKHVVARNIFKGIPFEVEAIVTDDALEIHRVSLLDG